MTSINFMPWRRQRLQRQWRCWRYGGVFLLINLICGVQYGYWQDQLNRQRQQGLALWPAMFRDIAEYQQRTRTLQQQIQQQQQIVLLREQRQQALSRWQAFVHLLEDNIPENTWLQSLQKEQQHVELQGFSHSIVELHNLRDVLRQHGDIQSVKTGTLRREPSGNIRFSMQLTLKNGAPDA